MFVGTPATAAPLDKGHFEDVFTDFFDCDGAPARQDGDVHINFLLNQRGSGPFPYYRESVHGSVVTTNLNTGGTYTNVFAGSNGDHTIVDNGDGSITITVFASTYPDVESWMRSTSRRSSAARCAAASPGARSGGGSRRGRPRSRG